MAISSLRDDIGMLDIDTSAFVTILTGKRTVEMNCDPAKLGIGIGSILLGGEHLVIGRALRIWSNLDSDDWFSVADKWYVEYDRPWAHDTLKTTMGDVKIEWLEDQMFPRTGRVIDAPGPNFCKGDIIQIVAGA